MPVFMFNDIESSTRLWEEHQEAMGQAVSRHDAILQAIIGQYGGRILRHRGDGISAVFESGEPLECAIAIQRAFFSEDWGVVGQIRIRLAVHAGFAERRVFESGTIGQKEEYFGPVLNRTARVMDAGWGGQILVTPEVVHSYALPPNAVLQDLGVHLLKDLHNPQRIYGLVHPDIPLKDFPPLRSLSSRSHNLVAQPTPFVGRDEERAKIEQLLADPDCRLLTLVGPGGIGKTRLALQVAAESIENFEHGVYEVKLASVPSPDLIIPAIVDALKPPVYSTQDPRAQLFNYLREKSLLLVLDNFEHLIDGAGLLAELLANAPKLKLMVTSRQRLNLQGEWLFTVDGLSSDGAAGNGVGESAVQLFVQSARRVKPDYALTAADRPVVDHIIDLVAGMPLGIELAAAWVQMLSPQEIVGEIEQNLDFLTTSLKDVPERHRSLRAVFDQSWNMLTAEEQEILKRLSQLPGGFRHETARRVANVSLPVLLELVDKSLLRRTADGRYEMHEFLRQHAQTNLTQLPPAIPDERLKTSETKRFDLAGVPVKEAPLSALEPAAPAIPAAPPAPPPVAVEDIQNPYKGLRAFQEDDADDFFGRDSLIDLLLERMSDDGDPNMRFLAVVGPSGSGKSSVVRAGLIPALRKGRLPGSENWVVAEMMPSAYPLEELESALLRTTADPIPELLTQLRQDERGLMRAYKRILPDDSRSEMLLVIDQFEEMFTLVNDEFARFHFLDSLMVALSEPRSRLRVVVTLRADFYDRPLRYPEFGRMMRERTEIVLPLSPEELEQAIVRPAERVGLVVGPDLIAAIIADVNEQPGALPLLQYTLTELFERRQGRAMTMDAYREVGGVSGALARRADELFLEMDAKQQETTRQLFLRLVTPGEGTEDTRRRVRLDELESLSVAGPAMEAVLKIYSEFRLLTFDRDPVTHGPTVEVAHEALIREWQRLRDWLDTSREDLRLHRRLASGASDWINAGRDPGYLLTGSRLAQYEEWVTTTDLEFAEEEWDFLVASMAEKEARDKAEQERLRREFELEQRSITLERRSIASERRAKQRLLYLVITLVIFLIGSLGLSAFALVQSGERQNALATAEFNQGVAQTQAAVARENSSLLLAASAELALNNRDTDLAILLALEAAQREASPEQAANALFKVADAPGTRHRFVGHTGWVNQVAYSPDGRQAISASADGSLILWNIQTGQELRHFEGHADAVLSVALSPDGRTALSGGQDGSLILWDGETGEDLGHLEGHTGAVAAVAFSPDGTQALSGSNDTTLILWDVTTGQELRRFEGHNDAVTSVVFNADGTQALSGSRDSTLILWDVATGEALIVFAGHRDAVLSVAFSSDGTQVLSGSSDTTLILWDVATGEPVRRFEGHTDAVTSVAFSPDGRSVLSGSRDKSVRLWNVSDGEEKLRFLGHEDAVTSVAFSPDGRSVLSGSTDSTLRLWDIRRGSEVARFSGHADSVYSVAFSPDGTQALSGSSDTTLILWDVATGSAIRSFAGHSDWVRSVAFSPDGTQALSGSYDTTLILWDVASGNAVRRFEGHSDKVRTVAFSPDGTRIVSGADDGLVIVWDTATGEEISRIETGEGSVRAVVFSQDGAAVLSGGEDSLIHVWDAASGEEIRQLSGHTATVLSLAVSPDGAQVLSGGADNQMILWDFNTGEVIRTYAHNAQVFSVVFSPDGQAALSSGSTDDCLILWDLANGKSLRCFRGHTDTVYSVAFSPDGKRALSGSADRSLLLWRIDYTLQDLIAWTQTNRYVGELTEAQREQYRLGPEEGAGLAMVTTPTPTPLQAPTDTLAVTATAIPPTATTLPTEPPTATETGVPTSTPTDTPTQEPTGTPTAAETAAAVAPTDEPPTATETEAPTSTPTEAATNTPTLEPTPDRTAIAMAAAPVLLRYDAETLVLFNRSEGNVDVSGLTFVQNTVDGERLEFSSDEWYGGSQPPHALPSGDCFQVWIVEIPTASLPIPDYCGSRHAWRGVTAARYFWLSDNPEATFEVRREDEVLATCVIGAGECALVLDPSSLPEIASLPSPTVTVEAAVPTDTPPPATPTDTPAAPTEEAATATVRPSATPRPSATARPSATPGAAAAGAATPIPDDTPVLLRYDGQTLVLFNRSEGNVDVSGLTFVQNTADGERLEFSSDEWYGGSQPPHALPSGDCFQVWIVEISTASLPIPDYCGSRHAWRGVSATHYFWLSDNPEATFEVRRDDEVLTTCVIGAGECGLPLE